MKNHEKQFADKKLAGLTSYLNKNLHKFVTFQCIKKYYLESAF